MPLSPVEKQELLQLARKSIKEYLATGKPLITQTTNQKFLEPHGVFVTLTKNSRLRGCIGYILPMKKLYPAVTEMAIAAAIDDPRFDPVTLDELSTIKIEISILSTPEKITLEKIIPGKHGIILENGAVNATFLPQVWEQLPTKNNFLAELCAKAGLAKNCYLNNNTHFKYYTAEFFSE